MKCWICGAEAKTGEHLAKASDLKAIFPRVTQKNPLFLSTDKRRNEKIGSIRKSPQLKSNALICECCNTAKTAPHDKAWEKLSKYLREKKPQIKVGEKIKLNKVFPGSTNKSMLDVHLFFVKLFGCAIFEHNISSMDITGFSEAIMNQKPHPLVYLAISPSPNVGIRKHVGRSNLEMESINGKCMYATWFYIIDSLLVNIIYAEPTERRKGLDHAWHPATVTKCIRISQAG
ncbi:MAG: hypothetical protein ACXWT1_13030 [Methylobacter sp.]